MFRLKLSAIQKETWASAAAFRVTHKAPVVPCLFLFSDGQQILRGEELLRRRETLWVGSLELAYDLLELHDDAVWTARVMAEWAIYGG